MGMKVANRYKINLCKAGNTFVKKILTCNEIPSSLASSEPLLARREQRHAPETKHTTVIY